MHFYRTDDLPLSKWRNGGGETREVISFPPDSSQFGWRASIATLAASGDFSRFPGVDRVITLIEGDGVELHSPPSPMQLLKLNQPVCFTGEQPMVARLRGGKSLDFNIMTRRDRYRATVVVSGEAQQCDCGVCWVVAGQWRVGEKTLARGEGAWWSADGELIAPLTADALLLFAEISQSGKSSARSFSRAL